MKNFRRMLALALTGVLACLPAAAAYSMADGAISAAPTAVYQDVNNLAGAFTTAPTSGDTGVTATSGALTLKVLGSGSSTQSMAAALTLKTADNAQGKTFGALCAGILKTTAPSAAFATADASLKLENTATAGIRTYSQGGMLFTYTVSSYLLRFGAVPLPDGSGIRIALNDRFLSLDVMPQIQNSRTMVPLRGIFENLGATVTWGNDTRTVTVKATDGKVITVTVDSKTAAADGKSVTLDTAPVIENGRTLVPVRFLAESLGAQVGWDNASQTVVIFYS